MAYTIQDPDAPASEKQISFLASLLAGRKCTPEFAVPVEQGMASGTFTKAQASEAIDALTKMPKREFAVLATGYYTLAEQTYVVVKSKSSGNHYAKCLVLGKGYGEHATWTYVAGGMQVLANPATKALTLEEAMAMGKLHGVCIRCGKPLTDPDSVTAGMGPVCQAKWNLA